MTVTEAPGDFDFEADRRLASPVARWRRNAELQLIIMVGLIIGAAYTIAALGTDAEIPPGIIAFVLVILGLLLIAHIAVRLLAAGADPTLLPLAALLHGIGFVMITRLDDDLAAISAVTCRSDSQRHLLADLVHEQAVRVERCFEFGSVDGEQVVACMDLVTRYIERRRYVAVPITLGQDVRQTVAIGAFVEFECATQQADGDLGHVGSFAWPYVRVRDAQFTDQFTQ